MSDEVITKKHVFPLQNTSVVFLKANFEYLRGNYRKAMKMLGSGPPMYTDKGNVKS